MSESLHHEMPIVTTSDIKSAEEYLRSVDDPHMMESWRKMRGENPDLAGKILKIAFDNSGTDAEVQAHLLHIACLTYEAINAALQEKPDSSTESSI